MAVANPSDSEQYVNLIALALQSELHETCGLRCTEVVKGGSLGAGTAVAGDFDLDLIVYSQDITPRQMFNNDFLKSILRSIHRLLSEKFQHKYTEAQLTTHALRFIFDGKIAVDLLPSPYWSSQQDYHSFLKSLHNNERRMLSCSAAKWQKEFFEKQPQEVKEYIKRAKAWRNKIWPSKTDGAGRPKSFLIGLLVAGAYDRSRTGCAQSVTDLVKNDVLGHKNLCIDWPKGVGFYTDEYRGMFHRPYIVDPANPFNNVYLSGIGSYEANSPEGTYEQGDGNWTVFVRNIDTLDLRKQSGHK